jgi:crossover junction endodeoxyribonuclease RuvC
MPRILAFDTGTTSGACADTSTGAPTFFTWHGARWSSPGEFGARLHHFDVWVSDLIALTKPERIVFEAPLVIRGDNVHTNADTVRLLYALAGEVERIAYRHDLPVDEENVQRVKKIFAGSGRAKKADVLFRCRQLGWSVKNEHEADAAALWFIAKAATDDKWQPPIMGGRAA